MFFACLGLCVCFVCFHFSVQNDAFGGHFRCFCGCFGDICGCFGDILGGIVFLCMWVCVHDCMACCAMRSVLFAIQLETVVVKDLGSSGADIQVCGVRCYGDARQQSGIRGLEGAG